VPAAAAPTRRTGDRLRAGAVVAVAAGAAAIAAAVAGVAR
jgi:hypothetical protein